MHFQLSHWGSPTTSSFCAKSDPSHQQIGKLLVFRWGQPVGMRRCPNLSAGSDPSWGKGSCGPGVLGEEPAESRDALSQAGWGI